MQLGFDEEKSTIPSQERIQALSDKQSKNKLSLATLSTSELESTLRGGLKEEVDDPVEAAARRAVAKMRKVGL